MQNLVVVSYTMCMHTGGPKNSGDSAAAQIDQMPLTFILGYLTDLPHSNDIE